MKERNRDMRSVIDSFIQSYEKEFDYYEIISRTAAQKIENLLSEAGVRAIVTYRAKNPDHLREKLIQREVAKNISYESKDNIYSDIWDLAGVRIALYFPRDREKIDTIIKTSFDIISETKDFPDNSKRPSYSKRFSGYWARHYRVSLKAESLPQTQLRYSQARIEIQVASVLMHAWSEVEHDLVYKPLNGELSEEEYSILDELNGLVLAGEIALERLQAAGNARIAKKKAFNNQYEVASFLYARYQSKVKDGEDLFIGNIDLLYKLMKKCGIESSSDLTAYLKNVTIQNSEQTISSQIIDNIIAGNKEKYIQLGELKMSQMESNSDLEVGIGSFLSQWIRLEQLSLKISEEKKTKPRYIFSPNNLKQFLSPIEMQSLFEIRSFRNMVIHGAKQPTLLELKQMTESTVKICEAIEKQL